MAAVTGCSATWPATTGRSGYDYLHVAIDDATRVAYVAVRPAWPGDP